MSGYEYRADDELKAIVQRKQYEMNAFRKQHAAADDDLQMRLSYAMGESSFVLRQALRRNKGQEDKHQLTVIVDIKRRSPTAAGMRNEVSRFSDAAVVAEKMHDAGAGVVMINTDEVAYNGRMDELGSVSRWSRRLREAGEPAPPVVMKDIVIHPLQLAQAAEMGATGAVVMACVVGPALEDMLDVATTMGLELIVEVHTPAECEKALEFGAGVIVVNQWDRITGKLHPKQAMGMHPMIPPTVLTIAAGGIATPAHAFQLADQGYDAVVLGRALAGQGQSSGKATKAGENVSNLIREISSRQGLPRSMLGMGLRAEDVHKAL